MNQEAWTSVVKQKKNFTQVSNSWILDLRLSWDSYRLLCYIDMQPSNWKFYKNKIKKDLWFWEQKYTSCMQQLKSIWYIKHYPSKDKHNKIKNRVIELFYCIEARGVPNQGVAHPGGGYLPPYINTNKTNTNKTNIKNINFTSQANAWTSSKWDSSSILPTTTRLLKNIVPPAHNFEKWDKINLTLEERGINRFSTYDIAAHKWLMTARRKDEEDYIDEVLWAAVEQSIDYQYDDNFFDILKESIFRIKKYRKQ